MITGNDIIECDYCHDDTGLFNTETGNHPICEENAVLKTALVEAVELIKAWHNMDSRHILTEKEYERMWELYQQSPEMKRINAALKGKQS